MVSRAQRTPFGEWWWTVDRLTLAAIGALMLAGVVLVARRQPAGRRHGSASTRSISSTATSSI